MRENLIDASRERTVYLTDFMRVVVVLRGASFTPGGEGRIVYMTCIQRVASAGLELRNGRICSCVEPLALLQDLTEVGDQLARVVDYEVVEEAEEIQETEAMFAAQPVQEPEPIGRPVAAANASQPEADPTHYAVNRYYDTIACVGCGAEFIAANAVTIVSFDPEDRTWDINPGHLSPVDGLLASGFMNAIDAISNGQVKSVHCSSCGLCFEEYRLNDPPERDEEADEEADEAAARALLQDIFGRADGAVDDSIVGRQPYCRLEACQCGHSLVGNGRILVKVTGRDRRYAAHRDSTGAICLEHSRQTVTSLQEAVLNRFQYAQCGGCNSRLPIYYAPLQPPAPAMAPAAPIPAPAKEPVEFLRPLEFDDEP